MLHIHSGDCAARIASGIFGGTHLVWSDNLFEGALPRADWGDPEWIAARAEALADYLGGRERAADLLRKRHVLLRDALAACSEVTLWFDSCLYDMMLLSSFLAFAGDGLSRGSRSGWCAERCGATAPGSPGTASWTKRKCARSTPDAAG